MYFFLPLLTRDVVCLLSVVLSLVYFVANWEYIRIGHWRIATIKSMWSVQGPFGLPIIGNVIHLWGNTAAVFKQLRHFANTHPSYYKLWSLHKASVNIHDPEDMEVVLGSSDLVTKCDLYDFLSPWLQKGLFTSSGVKWKQRHKLLTPAFHINILREFISVFEEQSNNTVKALECECDKEYTDVIPYMRDFAISTLCETTMGCKVDPTTKTVRAYSESIEKYSEIVLYRLFRPWLYADSIFYLTPSGRKMLETVSGLHKFTTDVIDERLRTWEETQGTVIESASGKKRYAFLDLLISQMKIGTIDYNGIREEVDTAMLGGHDTTTITLSFCLMLLANHPEAQDRILEELQSIMGDTNRNATYEELQSMSYLEMCIKESLRMFPVAPFLARQATHDFTLKGHKFASGIYIFLHVYDLHHNPAVWPDPERFDPDRFLPENIRERHPYAFVPFSAGPRKCIGQKFAMLEMKSVVAKILLAYVLEPVDTPDSIVFIADMVLHARDGIRVRFRKRTN